MITIGNRIFTEVTRPDPKVVEMFRGLPSSNINDEMNRLYCMHDYMKLLNPGTAKPLLGTAITVKAPIGDNLFFHQALDMAQPGDIIVVDEIALKEGKTKLMAKVLSDAGVEFVEPKGAFYFFPKAPGGDDLKFVDALQEELILAVPGRGFGMAGHIRLSCSVDEKIIARSAEGFKRAVAKMRG